MKKKTINNKEILQTALNDSERDKYNLCVIFVTKNKFPGIKEWQNFATDKQTTNDIKELFLKNKNNFTGYSYFTGISGLIEIDWDWSFAYHVALRELGEERMNTRTLSTPSGG